MILQDWLYLFIICLLGACSPGPSVVVILGFVFSGGRKSGISASFGHGLGVFGYAILCAFGLGFLIEIYGTFFTVVQFLGAFFLLYLSFIIIKGSIVEKKTSHNAINIDSEKNRFIEGFLIAILNPKIAVFFLSLFSQFLSSEQTHITHLFMAILAGGIDTIVYCIIVILASTKGTASFLENYGSKVSLIFGIMLIFLSLSLFVSMLTKI
ncbi:MAG: LysE family translocator [Pseudomonadota bacterium]|jgi:threonine/homoserine/homoserine lactone efflux protein|nr:LysE family translocator [Pseudomonadota bacterium]